MARLRTFIAVPLEEGTLKKLTALQEQLAGVGDGIKWVERENYHVTLVFLGEVDNREIVTVCRDVETVLRKQSIFNLELTGVGGFPTLRRPRTLWVGVGEGADDLRRIHSSLEDQLSESMGYRREARPFTPHVTLGRLQTEASAELLAKLGKLSEWAGGRSEVREIHVLSSELLQDGPQYTVLSRVRLNQGPRKKA